MVGCVTRPGAEISIVEGCDRAALEPSVSDHPNIRLLQADPDDLSTDPTDIDRDLLTQPITKFSELRERLAAIEANCRSRPLIPSGSQDLVVHDLVANRLDSVAFARALDESFRVMAPEGMFCTIALMADESVETGRFRISAGGGELCRLPLEGELLAALRTAGFHGITLCALHDGPVLVRERVEARAFVVRASSGTRGPCYDEGHAVIYKGPWSSVTDDDNHVFRRGERAAVCRKTYDLLTRAPYHGQFVGLPRYEVAALSPAVLFDCNTPAVRPPSVTKGYVPVRQPEPALGCCDGVEGASSCC